MVVNKMPIKNRLVLLSLAVLLMLPNPSYAQAEAMTAPKVKYAGLSHS